MKRIQMMCLAVVVFCGVLAQAQVTGSGTTNYIPLWTSSSVINDSRIFQSSNGNVGVATNVPGAALDVAGYINASQSYLIGYSSVLAMPGGNTNVAAGYEAMPNNTGTYNTAVGFQALQADTSATGDTAVGMQALYSNTYACCNTGVGTYALYAETNGGQANTAVGQCALCALTTGTTNTGAGVAAGYSVTTGSNNIFLGYYAGSQEDRNGGTSTGSYNIAIGSLAGSTLVGSNNYNIDIANNGAVNDSGTIRFGTAGQQTSFFAAGIRGVTTGKDNAIAVVIDSNGQLGTVSSSRRFKTDIHDMGDASRGVLRLRPVTFRYRKPYADGSQPVQYGLIAEEVAEVYPDLVAYGNDGQPESVKYQVLDSLLLNELQRQQAQIQAQQEEIQTQQQESKSQRAQIDELTRTVREVLAAAKTSGQAMSEVRTVKADAAVVRQ